MVTKKRVRITTIRGQTSYWLVLFIALALSVAVLLFQSPSIQIELTNKVNEIVENQPDKLNQPIKKSCVLEREYWQRLQQSLKDISVSETKQLIFDQLSYKKQQGCKISPALQQGIINLMQKADQPIEEFEKIFEFSDQLQHDIFQQQKYEQYQQQKKQLGSWVEDNIQPGESYEEVYSRELLLLQQEIFR
jgi:predicted nucleotidyltransferase